MRRNRHKTPDKFLYTRNESRTLCINAYLDKRAPMWIYPYTHTDRTPMLSETSNPTHPPMYTHRITNTDVCFT